MDAHAKLKAFIIKEAKIALAQVPFCKVEDYSNILFEPPFAEVPPVIFLKETKLSELIYGNIARNPTFTLINITNNQEIEASNRNPTKNELRGHLLRDYLNEMRIKNPDLSVYNAITQAIRNKYSTVIKIFKAALIPENLKWLPGTEGLENIDYSEWENVLNAMPSDFLDDFTDKLVQKIHEKIQSDLLNPYLDPQDITNNQELRNTIWEGIDFKTIYDETRKYAELKTRCLKACEIYAEVLKQEVKEETSGLTKQKSELAKQFCRVLNQPGEQCVDKLNKFKALFMQSENQVLLKTYRNSRDNAFCAAIENAFKDLAEFLGFWKSQNYQLRNEVESALANIPEESGALAQP